MQSDRFEDRKPPETIRRLMRRATIVLGKAGVSEPQRDVRLLMRWASGYDGVALNAAEQTPPSPQARSRFLRAIAERIRRRPVSQIVGGRAFYGRWFETDQAVLDPRPESEALVDAALAALSSGAPAQILDLGVGSGCLLLSVLAERGSAQGLGVDQSAAALQVAARNAARYGLTRRALLREGDWWRGIERRFDVILCNPPYISAAKYAELAPETRLWEPASALTPGGDGLAVYRKLAPGVAARLRPDGVALFEVGRGQAGAVATLFQENGLVTEVCKDLGGSERVVSARPRRNDC